MNLGQTISKINTDQAKQDHAVYEGEIKMCTLLQ